MSRNCRAAQLAMGLLREPARLRAGHGGLVPADRWGSLSSGFHRALLVAGVFLVAAAVIGLRAANTRGEPTGEITGVAEDQAAVRRV